MGHQVLFYGLMGELDGKPLKSSNRGDRDDERDGTDESENNLRNLAFSGNKGSGMPGFPFAAKFDLFK